MTGTEILAQVREALEDWRDLGDRPGCFESGDDALAALDGCVLLTAEEARNLWKALAQRDRENPALRAENEALREAGEGLYGWARLNDDGVRHSPELDAALARWREVAGEKPDKWAKYEELEAGRGEC